MSLLSKLFGGGKSASTNTEVHNGFTITLVPMKEGNQYRLSALIEKGGKEHRLIRADMFPSADAANEAALLKAKQVIDQVGDGLF
jgi:hypothetical protein